MSNDYEHPFEQWIADNADNDTVFMGLNAGERVAAMLGVDPNDDDAARAAYEAMTDDERKALGAKLIEGIFNDIENQTHADEWIDDALSGKDGA